MENPESYLTAEEVARILKDLLLKEKEDKIEEEESFEIRATLEHVEKIKRIGAKKAKKMIDELLGFERVSPHHAFKIAELMPRDEAELRPIFAKERFELTSEELKKMLEVIDKYRE